MQTFEPSMHFHSFSNVCDLAPSVEPLPFAPNVADGLAAYQRRDSVSTS